MSTVLLDRLRRIVGSVLSDQNLIRGVTLAPSGLAKVARQMDLTVSETEALLRVLVERLRRGESLSEDSLRADLDKDKDVAAEPDALGNVTLRSRKTGKSAFVRAASPNRVLARMSDLSEGNGRAMTSNEEDPDEEAEHWDAFEQTGFYGAAGSGCIVLAADTGRILLAHRSREVEEPFTWGNFGGAMASGADPTRNARKEFYEETGYNGTISAIKPLFVFQKGSFRYFNFLVVVPQEFQPDLNWEADDAAWVEFGDWPQPLHFGLVSLFSDAASVATIKAAIAKTRSGLTESVLAEETYDAEIRQTGGTYNFPWRLGARHGLATARFDGSSQIRVVSVRDTDGQRVDDLREDEIAQIDQQAIDFIGEA